MLLIAEDIHKSYGEVDVLKGVGLRVEPGEVISIVGASGAGKSTLLHILGSLERPDSGRLQLDNQDVFGLSESALAKFRNRHIGFVFQFHHLLPEFTALENVCMPAFIAGLDRSEAEDAARELLAYLGIERRLKHRPAELSGGEQQRVAVARALVNKPAVVLADEPSGNLDSENSMELHKLFFELRERFGQTFIVVTHNRSLADMADRKLQMQDGKIVRP